MKIIIREASYFRHSKNIQVADWNKRLIAKPSDENILKMKAERPKTHLGNKEQNAMFPLVFWSGTHFAIVHLFFARSIGLANKIADPGNWFSPEKTSLTELIL